MVTLIGLFAQGWRRFRPDPDDGGDLRHLLFLLIMPQQRRQKKWQAMLKEVKPGDKVVTSGGLTGAIMSVKDDAVVLRVPPDNIKLEIARSSIVTLTTTEGSQVLTGLQFSS